MYGAGVNDADFGLLTASPFAARIGPILVCWTPRPTFRVEIGEHCANTMGRMHGGFLAAVVDCCAGQGVRHLLNDGRRVVTLSTTTDFLGPANVGDVVELVVSIDRAASTVIFASCIATTTDGGPVAKSSIIFSVREAAGPVTPQEV